MPETIAAIALLVFLVLVVGAGFLWHDWRRRRLRR